MSKYDEAIGALKRCAEGDDDEAKKAKKALKAIEDGDKPPPEEKKDEKKEEGQAKAGEFPPDKDEKKDEGKASAQVFELAREVQSLKAERAAEKAQAEREKLLATRPDFDEKIRATLAKLSVEQVREACETWPRVGASAAPAAATFPKATRGETQIDKPAAEVDTDTVDLIDQKMGLRSKSTGIKSEGRSLELGHMTPEQAAQRLAALEKGAA